MGKSPAQSAVGTRDPATWSLKCGWLWKMLCRLSVTHPEENHNSSLWSSGKRPYHSQWKIRYFLKNTSFVLLDLGGHWESSHGTPSDHESGTIMVWVSYRLGTKWIRWSTACDRWWMYQYLSMSEVRGLEEASPHALHHCCTSTTSLMREPYNQRTEKGIKQLGLWIVWLSMWVPDKNRVQLYYTFTQGWPQHKLKSKPSQWTELQAV